MEYISFVYFLFLIILFYLSFLIKGSCAYVFIIAFSWFLIKIPFYFFGDGFLPDGIDPNIFNLENYAKIIFIKSLFSLFALFAFLLFARRKKVNLRPPLVSSRFFVGVLFVYLFLIYFYFYQIGGLLFFLENMYQRGDIIKGNYIFIILLFSISIFLIFSSMRYSIIKQLFIVLFLSFSIFISYGSRSFSVGLMVFWGVCYTLTFKKPPFGLMSPMALIIYTISILVIILTPALRQGDVGSLIDVVLNNWAELFQRISVPQVEFLVVDHFSTNSYWMGRSWMDLIYAICPSSYCINKPPMDDGVYLYNIFLHGRIEVGTAVNDLDATSYPFETWSIAYANFGIFGVIMSGVIFGAVLALLNNMYRSRSYFFVSIGIVLIGCVAINFLHFSNLYLFICLLPVFIFGVFLIIARKFNCLDYSLKR
ncbi:hypothetical protein [Comamonas aquatica]|uniref:hypothetical protein n=1 Tax=Comamonas aquatica TaxID=225991 RepID=UPI0024487184|nr:hypothetical protein [Comamonas aquatica]MDH0382067.1 hypothetical protein [Comamonas aquatica]MDH0430312.1 hypothetical protein [Comamonas aquatica]MDH0941178.1 hypothetical protein [Comamonas aquatica]